MLMSSIWDSSYAVMRAVWSGLHSRIFSLLALLLYLPTDTRRNTLVIG